MNVTAAVSESQSNVKGATAFDGASCDFLERQGRRVEKWWEPPRGGLTRIQRLIETPSDPEWLEERQEVLAKAGIVLAYILSRADWLLTRALQSSDRGAAFAFMTEGLSLRERRILLGAAYSFSDGRLRDRWNQRAANIVATGAWLAYLGREGRCVKGFPVEAFCQLLARHVETADGWEWRAPHRNTVAGGRDVTRHWLDSRCSYIHVLVCSGFVRRFQVPGYTAPEGERGPWRIGKSGRRERHGFNRYDLSRNGPMTVRPFIQLMPPLEPELEPEPRPSNDVRLLLATIGRVPPEPPRESTPLEVVETVLTPEEAAPWVDSAALAREQLQLQKQRAKHSPWKHPFRAAQKPPGGGQGPPE